MSLEIKYARFDIEIDSSLPMFTFKYSSCVAIANNAIIKSVLLAHNASSCSVLNHQKSIDDELILHYENISSCCILQLLLNQCIDVQPTNKVSVYYIINAPTTVCLMFILT